MRRFPLSLTLQTEAMSMFRVQYLPANDAWCVVVGGTHILPIDRYQPGKHLFGSREELVAALEVCGLGVRPNGTVYNVEA